MHVHRSGSGRPLLLHGVGHRWQAWTPVLGLLEDQDGLDRPHAAGSTDAGHRRSTEDPAPVAGLVRGTTGSAA